MYCGCVWGNANITTLSPVIIGQKWAVRYVAKVDSRSSSSPLLKKFNILKFSDLHKLHILTFVYKFTHNLFPAAFDDYFTPVTNIHRYHTRYSSGYFISFARTNCRKKSIKYIGPRLWNSLSPHIQSCRSVHSFKRKLKWHYLGNYWVISLFLVFLISVIFYTFFLSTFFSCLFLGFNC